MDSNHRYPAPKAGAIAARRHPEHEEDIKTKMDNKSIAIYNILDSSYPKEIRFIKQSDPFRFLCTVILSASNTDESAVKAENNLHSVLKTPKEIADADLSVIEDLIRSAGLYKSKARSIKALSAVVVEKGMIPETIDELVKIPGLGVKSANCYLEFIGKSAVIVDTHVKRVAFRLGLSEKDDATVVYNAIRREYDESLWSRISMTLNYHGRVCCHSRKPECDACPLSSICPSISAFS